MNRPDAVVDFLEADVCCLSALAMKSRRFLNRNVPAFVMRFTRKWPGILDRRQSCRCSAAATAGTATRASAPAETGAAARCCTAAEAIERALLGARAWRAAAEWPLP